MLVNNYKISALILTSSISENKIAVRIESSQMLPKFTKLPDTEGIVTKVSNLVVGALSCFFCQLIKTKIE